MITIVIADDQPGIVSSLSAILAGEPDLDIVATAGTGQAAVEAVLTHRPTLLLLDVRMPAGDGISVLTELGSRGLLGEEGTRVLVLTTFDLDEYVDAALHNGASGFLVKTVSYEQLVAGVRAVAAGDSVLAPSATRRLLGRYLTMGPNRKDPRAEQRINRLTPRERHLLQLIARGLPNAEVARQLHLSQHTVKTHMANILHKTESRDRAEAIVLAYDAALVAPGVNDLDPAFPQPQREGASSKPRSVDGPVGGTV